MERASQRTVERGGCQGINLVVNEEHFADLPHVRIIADSRPLEWTWTDRQRDFNRHLLEIRFTETVPRGTEIEVEAPFSVYMRPLYWPSWRERLLLFGERFTVWPPTAITWLSLIALPLFAGVGLLLCLPKSGGGEA
jgi:hypothetical protein